MVLPYYYLTYIDIIRYSSKSKERDYIGRSMSMSAKFLLFVAAASFCRSACRAAVDTMYNVQPKAVRRERNLDHWDADTLAYHLDNYVGHDVAVMFYAQWDRNSHSLAPLWDKIATLLDAGSSDSRLVMALFDCESNIQSSELCRLTGITHYPTLMFIGSGPFHDTDPFTRLIFGKKAGGIMGPAPVANTVKFQGNWQYGDAIYDWIRAMQTLSNWHLWSTQGFGKRLRNLFYTTKEPKTKLPVGIPPGGVTSSTLPLSSDGSTSQAKISSLEYQLEKAKGNSEILEKAVTRSSTLLDSVLFSSSQDVFAILYSNNAWEAETSPENEVLRTCALEMSLDYCQRIANQVATKIVQDLEESGGLETFTMESLEEMAKEGIDAKEPYCKVLESCLSTGLEGEECKPKQCPFQDSGCRLLGACLDPVLSAEYYEALNLQAR
jgi:hypothetical protein